MDEGMSSLNNGNWFVMLLEGTEREKANESCR